MIKLLIGLLVVVAAALVIGGIAYWIDEHMNKG